jgi:hypothetical protein
MKPLLWDRQQKTAERNIGDKLSTIKIKWLTNGENLLYWYRSKTNGNER